MPGRKNIFHINMLKQWHSPSEVSLLAEEVSDVASDEADDDVVLWNGAGGDEDEHPSISNRLDSTQWTELTDLLREFRDVLSNRPGKMQIAEYRIQTGSAPPIRLPPYRLPHAYRDIVKT